MELNFDDISKEFKALFAERRICDTYNDVANFLIEKLSEKYPNMDKEFFIDLLKIVMCGL